MSQVSFPDCLQKRNVFGTCFKVIIGHSGGRVLGAQKSTPLIFENLVQSSDASKAIDLSHQVLVQFFAMDL